MQEAGMSEKTLGQIAYEASGLCDRIRTPYKSLLPFSKCNWEASAQAVRNRTIEECINEICDSCAEGQPIGYGYTHKRLTLTKDNYEVPCPAEALHILKRASQSQLEKAQSAADASPRDGRLPDTKGNSDA
jgi:hypothetical protein